MKTSIANDGNHFSPRFMLPCSLWAENIFRSLHLHLNTHFWTRGFPPVMWFRLSEGRSPLSNTSLEVGALPLVVRIENDWADFKAENIYLIMSLCERCQTYFF